MSRDFSLCLLSFLHVWMDCRRVWGGGCQACHTVSGLRGTRCTKVTGAPGGAHASVDLCEHVILVMPAHTLSSMSTS